MKKYYVALILIGLAAVMYAQSAKNPRRYLLSGSVENIKDGESVYWMKAGLNGEPIDSAVVKDGHFSMAFKPVKKCAETCLLLGKWKIYGLPLIMENANITVQIPRKRSLSVVNGGRENKLFNTFNRQIDEFNVKLSEQEKLADDTTLTKDERDKATERFCLLKHSKIVYTSDFIRSNMPSAASLILLGEKFESFSVATLDSILCVMKEKCPKNELYLKLSKMRDDDKRTEVGRKFMDFTMNDTDGKPVRLSDIVKKNKITMIDFWASWCGSCKAEMPDVKKAYDKYRNRGFAILGVTLDNDANAWKLATKIVGIPWPQVFDAKGPKNIAVTCYGVRAIPVTVLINQKGLIIARNVRGVNLESTLEKLLK